MTKIPRHEHAGEIHSKTFGDLRQRSMPIRFWIMIGMDWKNWKTPTALEQYDYYTPIDASMGDMIGAFAAAYKATGDSLYLEKAKALADNITRHQRADGTIPTYFDSRKGSDWVNCMVYVADRLEMLADTFASHCVPEK